MKPNELITKRELAYLILTGFCSSQLDDFSIVYVTPLIYCLLGFTQSLPCPTSAILTPPADHL